MDDGRSITRKTLLRRLARLDVEVDAHVPKQVKVQGLAGATATIRPGRWAPAEVETLLRHLALSRADFEDTR